MQSFFKGNRIPVSYRDVAGSWNSMALAFLTFPQIQGLNHSFRTYISLEKLLEESR